MVIKKVELINKGNKGIKVTFDGHRKLNDNVSAKRKNAMTESFPLPVGLRIEFTKLKYFFLTMLGIWRDKEWSQYLLEDYSGFHPVDFFTDGMEKNLVESAREKISACIMEADTAFSKTSINGYEIDGTRIKILGTYEEVEGKPIKINLPFIDEDDDYAFHAEATELMKNISSKIFSYLKEDKLELGDIKALLAEYLTKDEDIERVKKQTDEENYEELMLRLEQAGAIVIPLEGGKLEKSLNQNNESVKAEVKSEKTITSSTFQESEDVTENQEEEINPIEDDSEKDTPSEEYVNALEDANSKSDEEYVEANPKKIKKGKASKENEGDKKDFF